MRKKVDASGTRLHINTSGPTTNHWSHFKLRSTGVLCKQYLLCASVFFYVTIWWNILYS